MSFLIEPCCDSISFAAKRVEIEHILIGHGFEHFVGGLY